MAWESNEKGNPAWLTNWINKHNDINNLINDIYNSIK